ncbi:hypothetical protein [Paenibacillus contaminans]|uniref:HEAT repeat domain-containing protein n=1 Tax=Paenibacillus contaminans TaxID=450362 RepID=A0A329MPP3_9BACL|nr:hypothetical protein [Paenibacillus contaminans]RAV21500.1 hypothetical protein DQG23_09515 [Paenibacillus contaminans]
MIIYTKKHEDIVNRGVDAIDEFLKSSNVDEKRSILFCLDKYLDPYFEYDLPYFDKVIVLLEKHLFENHEKEVKEEILKLLAGYSEDSLEYLAERIEFIESELLADAIYALGLTFNVKYVPILSRYENHEHTNVRNAAKVALSELSKSKHDTKK